LIETHFISQEARMKEHIKKARNGQKEAFEAQLNVPVTKSMKGQLEALAAREGLSVAWVARNLVERGLASMSGGRLVKGGL
jgi:hypothetical protein